MPTFPLDATSPARLPTAGGSRRFGAVRALAAGLCLAASLISAPATASLVQNSYANGSLNFTLNSPVSSSQNVNAGGFTGVVNGANFLSYCIELSQAFSFGTVYNGYTRIAASSAPTLNVAKASDLARLMGSYFASSFSTTTRTAAFQLAVWEIVYETGSTYSVSNGVFSATGDAGAIAQANSYLGALGSISGPIIALTSANQQDFITVVPVPPSVALFAGGLLFGLWGVRRRNSV